MNDWVRQGGTLIAHNLSTRSLISSNGIGNVKHLRDTFDNSEDYNFDLQREIYSLEDDISKEDALDNKVNLNII